jgi:hypothetical protein
LSCYGANYPVKKNNNNGNIRIVAIVAAFGMIAATTYPIEN